MLKFIPEDHPLQQINVEMRRQMKRAQDELLEAAFPSAQQICARVFEELRISAPVPTPLVDKPPQFFRGIRYSDLRALFLDALRAHVPATSAGQIAETVAERTLLVSGFADPDRVLDVMKRGLIAKVSEFPRRVEDIERGRNPGDVIDPYVIAASQVLLYGGDFTHTIGGIVAHKALMIVEDLLGHLHETVIGMMRGNVRVPDPSSEALDPEKNPFPGADIVQPPTASRPFPRFHQVKNKTGSAKGGDGVRIGRQLAKLQATYGGEIYFDALIGDTLRGHRSRAGILREAPSAVFLVGAAAFQELTGAENGPEMLLRIYLRVFRTVAEEYPYHVAEVSEAIAQVFSERHLRSGVGFLEVLLRDVLTGTPEEQDSRRAVLPRARRSPRRRR